MGIKTNLNGEYSFGEKMFDGSVPLILDGEVVACKNNTQMLIPTRVHTAKTEEIGGQVIKTPCHKHCVEFRSATRTNTDDGQTTTGYVRLCNPSAPFFTVKESDNKDKARKIQLLK